MNQPRHPVTGEWVKKRCVLYANRILFSVMRSRRSFWEKCFLSYWFLDFKQMHKIMDVCMPRKWKQNCVEPMGLLGKGGGLWKACVGLFKNTCPYLTHHEAQWTCTNKDNRNTLHADTMLGSKPLFLNSVWSRPYPVTLWEWHETSHQVLQCLLYTAHFHDYDNSIKLLLRRLCLLLICTWCSHLSSHLGARVLPQRACWHVCNMRDIHRSCSSCN